jgi:hypothetical protein
MKAKSGADSSVQTRLIELVQTAEASLERKGIIYIEWLREVKLSMYIFM